MSALALDGVTVRRGARTLLDAVSLTVGEGEAVGLVGASGAGKTTLVRVALALERPSAGRVRWGEMTPWGLSPPDLRAARARVAAVVQQPSASLDPRRSIGDSVAEPLLTHASNLDPRARADAVAAVLEEVGLSPGLAARRPTVLSGGEAQRVCVARALIARPSVILLDEPTSALDVSAAAGVLNLLRAIRRRGTALLVVSHDLAALGAIAGRLVVLEAGRVVESGPLARCYAEPTSSALAAFLRAGGTPTVTESVEDGARVR